MSNGAYIFEISEKSFDEAVLQNSHHLPVLVEFMGVWSEHCVIMADILSDLAKEFAGQFIFAKIDIDEQQALRKQYQIENIPVLIIFKDGKPIRVEQGQMQESDMRALLRDLGIFRESDAMREQAREKHIAGDTPGAILLLTDAIKKDPVNTRVAMDMVQIFIDIGQLENAKGLFNKLPEKDKTSEIGKSLISQLTFAELAAKTAGSEALEQQLQKDADDHEARFDLVICQLAQHQYESALDHLLHIIRKQADFKDGAAREMYIMIINNLTPNEPDIAQNYRRKLASLLGH